MEASVSPTPEFVPETESVDTIMTKGSSDPTPGPITEQMNVQTPIENMEVDTTVSATANDKEKDEGAAKQSEGKSWKSIVVTREEDRVILQKEFLSGKFSVWKPTNDETEPIITIADDVLQALVVPWTSSIVIKALGTLIPYDIIQRKLKQL
ncbi:hypothetical protein V2J09_000921 [Rumex salicifolius]